MEHAGYVMPNGYGQVRRAGKIWLAHRWAAHVSHGPCPPGQVVRHRCDNRRCVNPEHLEYGTQGDNLVDRTRRHRYRKLTLQDARAILVRLGSGATLREVAEQYGVSISQVHHIKAGKQWSEAKHVHSL